MRYKAGVWSCGGRCWLVWLAIRATVRRAMLPTTKTALQAACLVVAMHMAAYWGLWLVLGGIGCGLGYVPAWCPQDLPLPYNGDW